MKLFTIYNVPNGGYRVDDETVEDDIDEQELKDYKNNIIDELEQRFCSAIVLDEFDAKDVYKQLSQKL